MLDSDTMHIPLANLKRAAELGEQMQTIEEEINKLLFVEREKEVIPPVLSAITPGRKKRTMNAAARKRIIAAQKARWAKYRAEQKGG